MNKTARFEVVSVREYADGTKDVELQPDWPESIEGEAEEDYERRYNEVMQFSFDRDTVFLKDTDMDVRPGDIVEVGVSVVAGVGA